MFGWVLFHDVSEILGFHSSEDKVEVFWVVMLCSVAVGY
jgi:hypothetical protein